jgi:hydroxymethylpyrimidine pyrophosphatase-like HAD family hydrolase
MIKVLFLDIDGVLNTDRQQWHCQMNCITPIDEFGYEFDHKAVDNLATILEETGAEIVISSSWKFLGLQTLQKMWEDRKLPGTILDITPDGKSKGWEIDEWLMECESQVNRYAIIDDENDILPKQLNHFVQTNYQFGITCKDAERVITILR